jgi:hypothetical protein
MEPTWSANVPALPASLLSARGGLVAALGSKASDIPAVFGFQAD